MAADYYYSRDGQRFGPVSGKQLRALATEGQLRPTDHIWSPEKNSWIPAATIKALFPPAATPPRQAQPNLSPPISAVPIAAALPVSTPGAAAPALASRKGLLIGIGAGGFVGLGILIWVILALTRSGGSDPSEPIVVVEGKKSETTVPFVPYPDGSETKKDEGPGKETKGPEPKVEIEPKTGKEPVAPKDDVDPAARAAFEQGNAAMSAGNLDEAIRAYTRAVDLQPNFAWAYCKRGQAQMNKGAFPAAIADCNRALEIDPNLIDAYAFRGASEYDGKNYAAAVATSDRALKLQPRAAFFYFLRGNALVMTASEEQGIKDLDEAIRLDPKNPRYYHSRGTAHAKMKNDALAQADFRKRDDLDFGAMSPAKRQAFQRLQQAEADFNQASALYEGAYRSYEVQRNTYAAQAGRAAAMGIKLRPPQPPDSALQFRMNNARAVAIQARKIFESTP